MNFNGDNKKIFRKLKIKGKKETKNSCKNIKKDQSQESLTRNSKMIISSRSSFFDVENYKTYFKKDATSQKKNNMKDSETNTEPINQIINYSNQNTNTDFIDSRINLRKSFSLLNNENNFRKVDYNKNDKITPLMIINKQIGKQFNIVNNINIKKIISTNNRFNQQRQKNRYTDLCDLFSSPSDNTKNYYKNYLYKDKKDISRDFNEKFLVDSYKNNTLSRKKLKSNSKYNRFSRNPSPVIIMDNITNYHYKRELSCMLNNNNNNLNYKKNINSKSHKRDQLKNEYNKIFDLDSSGNSNKTNKNKEKHPLKTHSLSKTNIYFNPANLQNSNEFTIVENNSSLKKVLKLQTVSNFNNKYNLKYKTKNPKIKERIEELFDFMKMHKSVENSKNTDFLHLKRKQIQKNNKKFVIENYSSKCNIINTINELNNIYQKENYFGIDKKSNKKTNQY